MPDVLALRDAEAWKSARLRYEPVAMRALIALLVLLGISNRLAQFAHYRMLWLDEASIAVNVLTKSSAELLRPLIHGQMAPPAFLLSCKGLVTALGSTEYALRLPALISGVAAVVSFVPMANRAIGRVGVAVGLALMATSVQLIYYSAEIKPYATDALAAILLTWIALDVVKRDKPSWTHTIAFAALGAIAVYWSFPAIFVLAGIAAVLFADAVHARARERLVHLSCACASWAVAFVLLYVTILVPLTDASARDEQGSLLTRYWEHAFLPFPPVTPEALQWSKEHFLLMFEMPGGFRLTGFPAFIWIVGVFSLFRRDWRVGGIVLLPMLVTVAASSLRLYPFEGRLLLFLTPSLFLFCGEGIACLFDSLATRARPVAWIALILLVAPPFARGFSPFAQPFARNHLAETFEFAERKWTPGDTLYLQYPESVAYEVGKRNFDFETDAVILGPPDDPNAAHFNRFVAELAATQHPRRVWFPMTFDHYGQVREFLAEMDTRAIRVESFDTHGASIFAYEFEPETANVDR